MKRDDATERQVQAALPTASTWLSANAGSGKTRVLTDRVARLLLQGVEPQHILCLTYTKAAASEMQNRLFKRLGAWAMKDDPSLREELLELGVDGAITAQRLREARTLFARAIETPGGLKIQTIHSFCSALLRRFPLEAGVSPLFSEIEDRAASNLREEIISDMAEGPEAGLLRDLAQFYGGADFAALTSEIIRHAPSLRRDVSKTEVFDALALDQKANESSLRQEVFLGDEIGLITDLVAALRNGGVNDNKAAEKLKAVSTPELAALPILEAVFLTGAGAKEPFTAKIGGFPTKKLREAYPDLISKIEKLMLRVEAAREQRLALEIAHKSLTLWRVSNGFLSHYEERKQRLGWLDFDDLIIRARDLLNDPAVAAWVLFRLDGGIDHILVDEAQDTSPVQWQVIERLAQEFTSGAGARSSDQPRTIFVVGDKKQSIYSFQGADPAEFDRMREDFGARLKASETPLQTLELEYSFRSSDAILRVVDSCFKARQDTDFEKHIAFNHDLPGRVDLWPVIEPTPKAEEGQWFDPVDRLSETHHTVYLAQLIAREIKLMIEQKATLPIKRKGDDQYVQRAVRAGDFLILVQRRSDLFQEIIRACKSAGLPIAGADRLKVGAELAVKDLAALLKFLSTPEDDLSLATVLRSPLCGWSEQALFDLAHRRTVPLLWQALRERGDEFAPTMAILTDLMSQTDFLRPYDLIERILTRHGGRKKLLSRLGNEAEDGINALLSQALAYERTAVPSLTGFIVWMETDELEIKRQMDSAGNQIRVMTVHGAKGLEAPIVIMPDTGKRQIRMSDSIVDKNGITLWNASAAQAPLALKETRESLKSKQEAERQRLLYVAMTRAEKWLIVAAAGELDKSGETWYQTVEAGMKAAGATDHDFSLGQGLRLSHGNWDAPIVDEKPEVDLQLPVLEPFFAEPAPESSRPKETLSPSTLGGAKALSGDAGQDEDLAKARGRQIHLLLEHLPMMDPDQWRATAPGLLAASAEPGIDFESVIEEAIQVLKAPALTSLFDKSALAEVSLTAPFGDERLHGTIDRLIVSQDSVLAVDFKSNATVPVNPQQVPEGLLRQMGAYHHMLAQIYPNKRIDCALLWTKTASLMMLPEDLITNKLQDLHLS